MSYAKYAMGLVSLQFISLNALGSVNAFDTLGPDNTYGYSGVWFGHYEGYSATCAQQFTPTENGWLEEIYASIEPDPYTPDRSFTLRLLTDASNIPGETALWSTTSYIWPSPEEEIYLLADIGGPLLTAGQTYWLQADKPVVMGSSHDWYSNEQGYQGRIAFSENGGPVVARPGTAVAPAPPPGFMKA